jgi:hypothetical protein
VTGGLSYESHGIPHNHAKIISKQLENEHYFTPEKMAYVDDTKAKKVHQFPLSHLAANNFDLRRTLHGATAHTYESEMRSYAEYTALMEFTNEPDFYIEDVQLFFDTQIASGSSPRVALDRTRERFGIASLTVNPVGVISSPNIALPSSVQQQMDAQAEQQDDGEDDEQQESRNSLF